MLCALASWGAAVLANADEEKASEIIKLWPEDVARQDDEGMGTPRPDRGENEWGQATNFKNSRHCFDTLTGYIGSQSYQPNRVASPTQPC